MHSYFIKKSIFYKKKPKIVEIFPYNKKSSKNVVDKLSGAILYEIGKHVRWKLYLL